VEPKWTSIEEFGEFLLGEDRTSFTYAEACEVASAIGHSVPTVVIRVLKGYGFEAEARPIERRIRTISTSSHDRWWGPGSSKTHGGSGWEQITGIEGQTG
jgi:hypothetical protein